MSEIFDVAIVGYGPVGATLANLLSSQGVRTLVLEREPSVYHHPRAGHMDGEVVRVFQSFGLAEEIVAEALVNTGMQFRNARYELLLDWPRPQVIGPEGWHPSYRFHQPSLERALRSANVRRGNVEVMLSWEVENITSAAEGAVVACRSRDDGATRAVVARYVVGCDGARSTVRTAMGVDLDDLQSHERWLIVDVRLVSGHPDLPAETIQLCDPARPITMAKMVGNRRRWEIMLMPGDKPEDMLKPETFLPLLSRWVAPGEVEVERSVIYTFHSVIARQWRVGRLLLAGDSCHQTPPFMGQGMCAGIRDAANLAWKLAFVLQGRAAESLLDSYQEERVPHVREFIETAVRLGRIVHVTDPVLAAERDAQLMRDGRLMTTPAPRLGQGLQSNAPAPAGTRARQLALAGGERMDDRVGHGFALLIGASLAREAAALARESGLPLVPITDADPAVRAYLDELGHEAVLIRPDRYIMGVADTHGELRALVARIPSRRKDVAA